MKLKINFTLKTGVSGEIPVLAILNYGYKEYDVTKQKHIYKPLKYYTGIKVAKSEWDEVQKLPTKKAQQTELLNIDKQINDVWNALNVNSEAVTPITFKNALDAKIKGKEMLSVTRIRLIDFIVNDIIPDPAITDGTRNGYRTLIKQLERLETQIGKPVYSHEFDESYFDRFIADAKERNNKNNSVYNAYKGLRGTLNKIREKYKVPVFNLTLDLPRAKKVRGSNSEAVYLKFEQVQRIIDYKPEIDRLKNARLIFLTLYFTGVRYGDVFKVQPEHKHEKRGVVFSYARFITQKNRKDVIIPILKPLADAIAENGGKTATKVHLTQFNDDLKELAELCGLTEMETLAFKDSKGVTQFATKRICDFISSHTGRRSFITNLINHFPITVLSKITTHSFGSETESAIFKYNKITLIDNAVLFIRELLRWQKTDKEHFTLRLV